MLLELTVKNFALIDELHLSLDSGLNVFTGETGAGKSILIDALNQVLGDRADSHSIRTGSETCTVEALFDIQPLKSLKKLLDDLGYPIDDPDQLLIRRELSRNGKNRCWINNQLSTLSTLQQIGQEMVDLHGQHEHQSLLKSSKQLDVLDEYAGTLSLREKVSSLYHRCKEIQEELQHLKASDAEKQSRIELYRHQIGEIESANLLEGEEDSLSQQRQLLRHSEKLIQLTTSVLTELSGGESESGGIISALGKIRSALTELGTIDTQFESLLKQMESLEISADLIYREMRDYREKINLDPEILEEIEERLDLIHRLKRKYQASGIGELISMKDKWKSELEGLSHQEERIAELEKQLQQVIGDLSKNTIHLSEKRASGGKKLSQHIESELSELGIPHASFQINLSKKEDVNGWVQYQRKSYATHSTGIDEVEFLFSANPGETVKPLSKVISGGELSRVMLALKSIFAKVDRIPTLIFDEIDSGIGGSMASTVSRKLKEISQSRQVLVITHLPMIAASAKTHYRVTKIQDSKRTVAQIQELKENERVQEIARMTSGEWISDTSVTHAKELLKHSVKDENVTKKPATKSKKKTVS